jgi:hypothetical protein
VVLTTALRAPLRLAVTSVAVTTAVALLVVISVPPVVTSVAVTTAAALLVVISELHAVTLVPVSQPLANPWAPSLVMAEKYLCLVTLQSAQHVLHVNSSSTI